MHGVDGGADDQDGAGEGVGAGQGAEQQEAEGGGVQQAGVFEGGEH